MTARSCPEWEQVGTAEVDPAEYPAETIVSPPPAAPEFSSFALSQPGEDPQPFNPSYQLQTGITDWINLRALGARGDGVTDDTGIFQAANLIAQQPPSRMIYIPAGTYKLTSNITFSSGVQWLNMGTVSGGTLSGGTQINFGTSGLTNPMTTAGDIITGGTGGAPQRLGVGLDNQVLTSLSGAVSWQNSAAGFTNPMTAGGDMIYGLTGGTPNRLVIGSPGQVLTVVGGNPTWQNSASGFGNPMTTKGDLIFENATPAPARLPIGAAGQLLGIVSGVPAWVNTASTVVTPSGDTTGATDQAAIATALNGLPNGGTVVLGPGDFYVSSSSTAVAGFSPPAGTCIFLPQQTTSGTGGGNPLCLRGQGSSTVIHVVGSAVTGIYAHRSSGYGAQFGLNPADLTGGFIRDLVISGENPAGTLKATGASVGLDCGDAWGLLIDNVTISNFTGTGGIGLLNILRVFWNEKQRFHVNLLNNDTAAVISTAITGDTTHHSGEYQWYDITMFCNANQNGVIVDGLNMGGSQIFLKGNMSHSNSSGAVPTGSYGTPLAALAIVNHVGTPTTGEVRWYEGQIWMKVEANPGNGSGSTYPYCIYSDGVGVVQECSGHIHGSSLTASNINNAEFSFHGAISADTNLAQAFPGAPGSGATVNPGSNPAVPATGVIQQNYGPDAVVCVFGGTVSGVTISGQPTGLTTGPFFINAGGSITLNYTVAPSWNWCPAAQMTY